MPLYDFECPSCGADYEVLLTRPSQREGYLCEECGEPGKFPVRGAHLVGPTDTNPLRIAGVEREFTSQSQVEAWSRETGQPIYGPGDKTWDHEVDKIRNRANDNAKKAGFRDRRHRLEHNTEQQKVRSGKYERKRIYSGA